MKNLSIILHIYAPDTYIIHYNIYRVTLTHWRNFLKQMGWELEKPDQFDRLTVPHILGNLIEDNPFIRSRKKCYICYRSRNPD